jgi:hypothetical protein
MVYYPCQAKPDLSSNINPDWFTVSIKGMIAEFFNRNMVSKMTPYKTRGSPQLNTVVSQSRQCHMYKITGTTKHHNEDEP